MMIRGDGRRAGRADLDPSDGLLTDLELADRWAVSPKTLANWRSSGLGVRFVKLGRRVRYRLADVLKYEADRTFENTAVATALSRAPHG